MTKRNLQRAKSLSVDSMNDDELYSVTYRCGEGGTGKHLKFMFWFSYVSDGVMRIRSRGGKDVAVKDILWIERVGL